jgi:hypothetical protein
MDDPSIELPLDHSFNATPLAPIAGFLLAEGWPFERVGEQMLLRTAYQGKHGEWVCFAYAPPIVGQYFFYSVAPQLAPAGIRPAVAEYVSRANWGLLNGNFELDFNDGEVRFKNSIRIAAGVPAPELLRALILENVVTMDRYLPGLRAVMTLAQTPVEAIQAVEREEEREEEGEVEKEVGEETED